MHVAALIVNVVVLCASLERGPSIAILDSQGKTALDVANETGHGEVVT